MNNDLISRKALLRKAAMHGHSLRPMVTAFHMCVDVKDIKNAPAVDPTPVGYKLSSASSKTGIMCSKCLKDITEDALFCKYCGAKMEGDLK